MSDANRDNAGKIPLSYIIEFPESLRQVSARMASGAIKYDRHNWQKGQNVLSCIDSMMRHLSAFANGCDKDHEDPSLSNMSGVIVNAMFIIDNMHSATATDDRRKPIGANKDGD